ncbi:MAG: AAA family ATPase [Cyanobacterium sp. T60_A2020_053]|nr:AAA family ATPase [Cyanobacterium sp. T60_A2020_053]
MLLSKLFVRFYKSFNYDYLKKSTVDQSQAQEWEWVDNDKTLWFPYVEIPIDGKITTVVGANESGKSHLLSAIEKGITGQGIEREDFCRYSQFFTVTKDKSMFPNFGFEWKNLTENEQSKLREFINIPKTVKCSEFLMFRTNQDVTIYLKDEKTDEYKEYPINDFSFSNFLPSILPINSKIALPDSVSIQKIINKSNASKDSQSSNTSTLLLNLEKWKQVNDLLNDISKKAPIPCDSEHTNGGYWHDDEGRHRRAEDLERQYLDITTSHRNSIKKYNELQEILKSATKYENDFDEVELAYKLICNVAEIDVDFLAEIIKNSFNAKKQGYVAAIIDKINKSLSERLNFPSWWVQDKEFKLVVSLSNYHLKFAIKDKTGSTYSFSERSQGLKYFLSYYIQYKAHNPIPNKSEILLMDEPDAFLSSQAQQDLMKIFKAFADGKDKREPVQVIFVTHSPFLIDKNNPKRLRVLEKGAEEEGTRVVNDIGRNHYEPLRTSVGSLVGETAFMGNCNLIVSRLSDQILIAGLTTYFNELNEGKNNISAPEKIDLLDLNHITIIPAGDVTQIPYMIKLLRQDTEKPAIITVLNADKISQEVYSKFDDDKSDKFVDAFVILIKSIEKFNAQDKSTSFKVTELEDLIPLSIAVKALLKYAHLFTEDKDVLDKITVEKIKSTFNDQETSFINLQKYMEKYEICLDRFGFVKSVLEVIKNEDMLSEELDILKDNFKLLFEQINDKKRKAELEFSKEKIATKVSRFIKTFEMDYPKNAKKVDAEELFNKIENILDNSKESNEIIKTINEIRKEYQLQENPLEEIKEFQKFIKDLSNIKYSPVLSTQEKEKERLSSYVPNKDTKTTSKRPPKGFQNKN